MRWLAHLCLLWSLLGADPAHAIPVTFGFRAIVTAAQDSSSQLSWNIHVGDTIEGSYTFKSEAQGSGGFFNSAVTKFDVNLANAILLSGQLGAANIEATDRTVQDTYYVRVDSTYQTTFGGVSVLAALFDLLLVDPTGQVYFGDPPSPPVWPPDLADFANQSLSLQILDQQSGSLSLSAQPTALYLAPEPGTGALLLGGLLGLALTPRASCGNGRRRESSVPTSRAAWCSGRSPSG